MRRFPALFALAVLPLVAACSSGSDTSNPPGGSPGTGTPATTGPGGTVPPVRVVAGSVASLTGSGAAYGVGQQRGIELAASELGAVTVVGADDTSTPEGGRQAVQRVIDDGAGAVLGPTLSPVAAEADTVAQGAGVPVLAVTNTTLDIDAIGDKVWRVSLSEQRMIPAAIEAAKGRRPFTRATLVFDEADDYARGAAQAFRDGATRNGITLTGDVGLPAGADPAQALRTATGTGNPEVLFLAARSQRAIDLLTATRAASVTLPMVGGNGFNAPEVLAGAGPVADGLVVAASWNIGETDEANARFVQAYRARFGVDPDAFAAQGYAGVQILAAAAAKGGGGSPAQVQAGLGDLGEVDTVLGRVRFDGREAVYPAAVQVVRNGSFELLG